jgi:two-component system sensor histidine kinase QseC
MRRVFRPTLIRRVFLALLLAFSLIWLVLVAYAFATGPSEANRDAAISSYGESLVAALASVHEPGEARSVVRASAFILNHEYQKHKIPTVMAIQLWDSQGQLLFASEESGSVVFGGEVGKMTEAVVQGRPFRVFRGETPRWQVAVAQPKVADEWFLLYSASNLIPYMLIAFPCVLLPLWIAVSQGLRPLRAMSQQILARDPDDLSATGITVKYEEMQPLVQALDSMLAKLRNKVERETAFIQEAAHELRTPMAVISAQAHVLAKAELPQARREAEQRLDQALTRASHLIGQLLQLAHIGGERALETVHIDLAQEVRAELALLVPLAMQRQLDLSMEAPDALWCSTERHTFKSILQNLVGNAIRYVNEGGRIVVRLEQQGTNTVLTVADDGPGIADDQRDLVFERFHRGTDHAAHGAGLGLAIVKQACTRLGGAVRLEPGLEGRGCKFVVTLPGTNSPLA